nr:unnamed protein product [Digitaria exilis]
MEKDATKVNTVVMASTTAHCATWWGAERSTTVSPRPRQASEAMMPARLSLLRPMRSTSRMAARMNTVLVTPTPTVAASTSFRDAMPAALKMRGL